VQCPILLVVARRNVQVEPKKTPREQAEDLITLLMPDWRPTPRQGLWAIRISIVMGLLVAIGYSYGITLWDWAQLLIVPAALAGGVAWLNWAQRERERQSDEAVREREREAAAAQRKRELEIASQRAQDEALQAYLDQMSQLLLDKDRPLLQSEEGDEIRTLARARTLSVLGRFGRLDSERKANVLQFLYESRLITKDRRILDLAGVDLTDTELPSAVLRSADLRGTDLGRADLRGGRLEDSDLSEADLGYAVLTGSKLNKTDLSHAFLESADLNGADLSGANLSDAALGGANLNEALLKGANLSGADLSGATGLRSELLASQIMRSIKGELPSFRDPTQGAWLAGADLSDAVLVGANLSGSELFMANFEDADLRGADLSSASLHRTILIGANLRSANLSNANLTDAYLVEAQLRDADLGGADLSRADLREATGWTREQLTAAKRLEGATMPNGQKYEHWLTDKESSREDEGENSGPS
jgi:uncharacterized protein YjbI with pentapeptide repeats